MSESVMEARERAEWYRTLSECYYPPEKPLLLMLQERGDSDGAHSPACPLPRKIPDILDLQKDYASLFVGPFEIFAPPYGSVYLEGEECIYGDSTLDARRRYEEEGLEVTLKEPPDHVAVELEYMYLLTFKEMEALAGNRDAEAVDCRKRQGDFLEVHLGAWMPVFAQRVMENAQTEFYRQIAAATESYIQQETANTISSMA